MGCGSSATKVEHFKPPQGSSNNNKQSSVNQQDTHVKQEQHRKKPTSATSNRSGRPSSSKYEYTSPRDQINKPSSAASKTSETRRGKPSSASSKTSERAREKPSSASSKTSNKPYVKPSSANSRISEKAREKPSSANSRTSDRQRIKPSSATSNTSERSRIASANDNILTNTNSKEDDRLSISQDENKYEDKHETKDEVKHETKDETNETFPNTNQERASLISNEDFKKSHERRAQEIEKKRSRNFEDEEEVTLAELNLVALEIPPMNEQGELPNYSVDDIVEYNAENSTLDWFKYGRRVYSWVKMRAIIKDRVEQYAKIYDDEPFLDGNPISIARRQGVSRKELKRVLAVCLVGNSVDVPRDHYLSRLKQSIDNILDTENDDDLPDTEYMKDYKDQLSRWLEEYPLVQTENTLPDANTDPNEMAFPLPRKIMNDPSVLRKWIVTWEKFDTEVPEEGAWTIPIEFVFKGTHDEFPDKRLLRDYGDAPEFDMTIDGEVAWMVIDLDLFKRDATTEAQEEVWKSREGKTYLNDPKWLQKRRVVIADRLVSRHEWDLEKMDDYVQFFENLEMGWEEFQELCKKEFVPPTRVLSPDDDQMPDPITKTNDSENGAPTSPVEKNNNVDEPNIENSNDTNNENVEKQNLDNADESNIEDANDPELKTINEPNSESADESNVNEHNLKSKEEPESKKLSESNNEKVEVNKPPTASETGDNSDDRNNDIRGIGASPNLEKTDSGLELDTPEQFENENNDVQ